MRPLTLLLVVLAACNTADLSRDVCGNGVVEQGEDCDDPDNDNCVACGITCTPGNDLTSIAAADTSCAEYGGTDGFVCGADGFCHAPSGEFEQASRFSTPASSFLVTDVNKDGIGDVVVQSQSSISAVFGSANTNGITTVTTQTPIARGPAAFAHVDNDLSADVLLPTADGVVSFTSAFGVPAPFPFAQPAGGDDMGTRRPVVVRPITGTHLGVVAIDKATDALVYFVLETNPTDATAIGPVKISDDIPVCDELGKHVAVDEIDFYSPPQPPPSFPPQPPGPGHQVIALNLHPAGGAFSCVLIADETAPGQPIAYTVQKIQPNVVPETRPVLGDLRGNPNCPSLVVGKGGKLVEFPPNGTCGLAAIPRELQQTGAQPLDGSIPVGIVPLVPVLLDPNASTSVLVTSTGVFAINPGAVKSTTAMMYPADRPLATVQVRDVDNDGDLDIVASCANTDDLDILKRRHVTADGFEGFIDVRFDTAGPITTFQLGDFDGNGFVDVAFVERVAADSERLEIAYGTSDQLLPGAIVGAVRRAAALIPAQLPDSGDPFGAIDDLAFIFLADDNETLLLSLLHGSTRRTMMAFFDPRDPTKLRTGVFRGAVVGAFAAGGTGNDVLAVLDDDPVGAARRVTRLFLSAGDSSGAQLGINATGDDVTDADFNVIAPVIADCPTSTVPGQICMDTALYATLPNDFGLEDAVMIDGGLNAMRFDPSPLIIGGDVHPITMALAGDAGPITAQANSIVKRFQRLTAADGSLRILIATGPDGKATPAVGAATGKVLVCIPGATELQCTDIGAAIEATGESTSVCIDAAIARVAPAHRFAPPDGSTAELVVVCHDTSVDDPTTAVFRVGLESGAVQLLGRGHGDNNRADGIEVGDVSGDGIDDIVLIDRTAVVPFLTVFRQCNSRDFGCGLLLGKQ